MKTDNNCYMHGSLQEKGGGGNGIQSLYYDQICLGTQLGLEIHTFPIKLDQLKLVLINQAKNNPTSFQIKI